MPASDESVEERRRRILEATLNLLKEEEEIEDSQRANRNGIGTVALVFTYALDSYHFCVLWTSRPDRRRS